MEKLWNVSIDGSKHIVVFKASMWTGKKRVIIDNREKIIKNRISYDFVGMDVPIIIGGKECRLVVKGGKADIAVNGTFVDSQCDYMPLSKMPYWNWIFIILCLAIPVVSMGGAIPMALAILGVIGTCKIATSSKINTTVKILFCCSVLVVCWILWIALMYSV